MNTERDRPDRPTSPKDTSFPTQNDMTCVNVTQVVQMSTMYMGWVMIEMVLLGKQKIRNCDGYKKMRDKKYGMRWS